jgi:hypothetical protein
VLPRPVHGLDPRVHQPGPPAGVGQRARQQEEAGEDDSSPIHPEIRPDPPRHPLLDAGHEERREDARQRHQGEEVAEGAEGVAGQSKAGCPGVERPGGHGRPEAPVAHRGEPSESHPGQEGRAHFRPLQRLVPLRPPNRLIPVGALGLARVENRLAGDVHEDRLPVGDEGRHRRRGRGEGREGRDLQAADPRPPSPLDPQQGRSDGDAHQDRWILRREGEARHRSRQQRAAIVTAGAAGLAAAHGPLGTVDRGEDEEGSPGVDGDHRSPEDQRRQDRSQKGRQEPGRLSRQAPRQEPRQHHDAETGEQGEDAAQHDQLRRLDEVVEHRREGREVLRQRMPVHGPIDRRAEPGRRRQGGQRQRGVQIPAGVPSPGAEHADDVMEDMPLVDIAEVGEACRDRRQPEAQREEEDRGPEHEAGLSEDRRGDRHGRRIRRGGRQKKTPLVAGFGGGRFGEEIVVCDSVSRDIYGPPPRSVWSAPSRRAKKTQEM